MNLKGQWTSLFLFTMNKSPLRKRETEEEGGEGERESARTNLEVRGDLFLAIPVNNSLCELEQDLSLLASVSLFVKTRG